MPEDTAQLRLVPKQRQPPLITSTLPPQAQNTCTAWNCSSWQSVQVVSVATPQKQNMNLLSQPPCLCCTPQQMHHLLPSGSACVCLGWTWTCGSLTGAICISWMACALASLPQTCFWVTALGHSWVLLLSSCSLTRAATTWTGTFRDGWLTSLSGMATGQGCYQAALGFDFDPWTDPIIEGPQQRHLMKDKKMAQFCRHDSRALTRSLWPKPVCNCHT